MIEKGPLYWMIGAALTVCLLVGIVIGVWAVPALFPPEVILRSDPIEQYYRGAIDMCRKVISSSGYPPGMCDDPILPQIIEKKWYEEQTANWKWPLPSPTPSR